MGELDSFRERLLRVWLEDQNFPQAEFRPIVVPAEGRRQVALPQVHVLGGGRSQGLVSGAESSKVGAQGGGWDFRRNPEERPELALGESGQTALLGDGDLRVEKVGCTDLAVEERLQPPAGPADVVDADLVARKNTFEGAQCCEMGAGHEADPDRDTGKLRESRQTGIRTREDGKPRNSVKVGDEFAHPCAGVADRPPLAGGVGNLDPPGEEGLILWALEVGILAVRRNLMHHIAEQFGLKTFALETAFLERDPLVEPHEMRDNTDGSHLSHGLDYLPMSGNGPIQIDGRSLRLEDVQAIARQGARAELAPGAIAATEATYEINQQIVHAGRTVYGVTTGVGDSVGRKVAAAGANHLQESLIRLNGTGTGPDLAEDQSRAVVVARANCLARGNSAVRPVIPEMMLQLLNLGYAPAIPEQGSIGASGDLVPSSYIGAVLMGDREVLRRGERLPAAAVWDEAGREPVRLHAKEGLAILNGTCFMTGIAALAVLDAERIARLADVCTALTCEGLTGISGPFDPFIQSVKPHPGQARSAARIMELLRGSKLVTGYDEAVASGRRVQDSYSLRCAPQCNGMLYDTLRWVREWIERELNSANDNPLYDASTGRVHSGGNFSGFHVALAMDSLKMAVSSVADLVDRQFQLLVDEKYSAGLPPNLSPELDPTDELYGTQHGFKSFQIALSSLTAEALGRCMPMSAFSRSTEAHNQDKVSMGAAAARAARDVIEIVERCCAMHLLGACQAADLRGSSRLGEGTAMIYERIRAVSPVVESDRPLQADIMAVAGLIRSGKLLAGL